MTVKIDVYYNNIVLIGLISDTHIGYPSDILPPHIKILKPNVSVAKLPHEVTDALRGVDLILHAGDIYVPSVLEELQAIAPVRAAWGDDDLASDFGTDPRLKKRHTLDIDGVTLWLSHVRPAIWLVDPDDNGYLLESEPGEWEDPSNMPPAPDIIVHGHTHASVVEYLNEIESNKNVLVVNPGSATFPGYVPKLGSIGLLTINGGKVKARIVPLS